MMLDKYTLDYCVKSALSDIGETGLRYYQQFLKFGIDCYRRMNLGGLMPTNTSIMLDIDTNTHSAELPPDYVDFLKIGLCINGHVVNFDYNETICTGVQLGGADFCTDCASQIDSDITNIGCGCTDGLVGWWWYPYSYNDAWYGGLYGYSGARYHGGYKIVCNRICFDSHVKVDRVLLEYKSNGIAGAATIVPEGAIGVVRAYIHLQRVKFSKDRTTRLEIVPFKSEYNAELMGFRARKAAMTAHDWKHAYLQSFSQTVKR